MTTKLNLTIDEEVVAKAKVYAAKRGTSVSRLVENLLSKELKNTAAKPALSTKLAGILSGKLSDEEIENIKKDEVFRKHDY